MRGNRVYLYICLSIYLFIYLFIYIFIFLFLYLYIEKKKSLNCVYILLNCVSCTVENNGDAELDSHIIGQLSFLDYSTLSFIEATLAKIQEVILLANC